MRTTDQGSHQHCPERGDPTKSPVPGHSSIHNSSHETTTTQISNVLVFLQWLASGTWSCCFVPLVLAGSLED